MSLFKGSLNGKIIWGEKMERSEDHCSSGFQLYARCIDKTCACSEAQKLAQRVGVTNTLGTPKAPKV